MSSGNQPSRSPHSLFDAQTLEGLHAATLEAQGGSSDPALQTCLRIAEGVEACDAGRLEEARQLLRHALADTTDPRLLFLGYQFEFRTGDYDETERLIERRLTLADPESVDAARAWNNLGLLCHMRQDDDRAEVYLRKALEMDRGLGCELGEARDLGSLSLIAERRGDLDQAERLNHESLAIAERIGSDAITASRLCNLGEIAMQRGRDDEARGLLQRAETLFASLCVEKSRKLCVQRLEELRLRGQGQPRSAG